jgi:hypothetical protein
MKFRINFTYVYDVDSDNYPEAARSHPKLMAEHEAQFLSSIIKEAIDKKKPGILLTLDVVRERPSETEPNTIVL